MSDNRPLGYGRYQDDPEHVGCPRAKSDMTPCIARDGSLALADGAYGGKLCVGCGEEPRHLLRHLQEELVLVPDAHEDTQEEVADRLRDLIRVATA